jgi:AcrR family transcriptional regulator
VESITTRNGRNRRPGGRTAEVTQRVNRAVLDLLIGGGTDACSFTAVAERAAVERSTLYRRYADQWEMMIDAFLALAADDVMPAPTGSLVGDLKSVLVRLLAQLESPLGPALLAAVAALRAHSGEDYSRAYFDRRMAQLTPMFDAAVARGELAPGTDTEELFSMLAGPIYFRMFIAARPVEPAWIDRLVDRICSVFVTAH